MSANKDFQQEESQPTILSPEVIEFVEWTQVPSLTKWTYDAINNRWFTHKNGRIDFKTTEQLFKFWNENIKDK